MLYSYEYVYNICRKNKREDYSYDVIVASYIIIIRVCVTLSLLIMWT